MLPKELKDIIMKNFCELCRDVKPEDLARELLDKNALQYADYADIFATTDDRHNRRMLYFTIIEKGDARVFDIFVNSLETLGYEILANIFKGTRSRARGTTVFQLPNTEEIEPSLLYEEMPQTPIHDSASGANPQSQLVVSVTLSTEFRDVQDNRNVKIYSTRSKVRGRVIIINNYIFTNPKLDKRKGAEVDERNLVSLFTQIGCEVELYSNRTTTAMEDHLDSFATSGHGDCDTCFVILMSHGNTVNNETLIYGTDGSSISTTLIEEKFNNPNCELFRGKPKVFLYQVCRGLISDTPVAVYQTATDSARHFPEEPEQQTPPPAVYFVRSFDDMLVGHATLPGYTAHRDLTRGTWYIEIICQKFMKHAHDHTVIELLQLVDEELTKRTSERFEMQTSSHTNIGFKKLYLNPGIYEETDGSVARINPE